MRSISIVLILSGFCIGTVKGQTNEATTEGAIQPVAPNKSSAIAGSRTVNSTGSAFTKKEDKAKMDDALANPEEEKARSAIQPEDNSPDVGMFVVMANKGWDSVNPASPNKPVYQQVIQERGTAPTYSNNMMDSPDGSSRPNDGWKLFGWTY